MSYINEYKQFKKILKLFQKLYEQRKSFLLCLRILIDKYIKFELNSIFNEFCLFFDDNEILKFFYMNDIIFAFTASPKKKRLKFDLSIKKHLRHKNFKFIELFFRCLNFAKIRHDLINTKFLYK